MTPEQRLEKSCAKSLRIFDRSNAQLEAFIEESSRQIEQSSCSQDRQRLQTEHDELRQRQKELKEQQCKFLGQLKKRHLLQDSGNSIQKQEKSGENVQQLVLHRPVAVKQHLPICLSLGSPKKATDRLDLGPPKPPRDLAHAFQTVGGETEAVNRLRNIRNQTRKPPIHPNTVFRNFPSANQPQHRKPPRVRFNVSSPSSQLITNPPPLPLTQDEQIVPVTRYFSRRSLHTIPESVPVDNQQQAEGERQQPHQNIPRSILINIQKRVVVEKRWRLLYQQARR